MKQFGGVLLAVTMVAFATAQSPSAEDASQQATEYWGRVRDNARMGPVDYGDGPGVLPNAGSRQTQELAAPAALATPVGRSDAHIKGYFAPPIGWPLIPIHTVLMGDGWVLSYGTNAQGAQGAQLIYDIWNPATRVHRTLSNTTRTDIFCSGQSVMANGEVLITGGDLTINGQRNFSTQKTTIFNPNSETIRNETPMQFARWYPTVVSLPNGDKLALGGRQDPDTFASTPEVFTGSGWRTLTNASSDFAYGSYWGDWYYPKAFTGPNGKVFVLGAGGDMFYLNTAGAGTLTELATKAPFGDPYFPSLMYAPAKILSLRRDRTVALINLSGAQPTVTTTQSVDQVRIWGNTTVMADGRVFVNGGSAVDNEMTGVSYTSTIWSPTTGQWTTGATTQAKIARLYHSTSLLLPDGSVLTAGGGAGGPVTNLNAEIYYPPYLFKTDGSGQPASRPTITGAPAAVNVGQQFGVTIAGADTITRVTLVRTGSVTHAFNPDQRYMGLSFTQNGQALSIKLPTSRNNLLPGYYLLFVFKGRVPSVARVIHVV